MRDVRGRFLWYEIMTPALDSAVAFYTAVIGWGTQVFEQPGMTYTMFTTGDVPIAGAWQHTPEMGEVPPHWVAYVGTNDIAATVRRAKELGASVHVESEVPGIGKFANLEDPQSAAFALYQPANDPGEEADPSPKEFAWHELATTDGAAALRFYGDLFGWSTIQESDMGSAGTYVIFGRDSRMNGGMYNKPADMPAPPHWLLYVRVADLDAAVGRVRDAGGQVLNGPMEVPGGNRIAQCVDPQGAVFALHERRG